MITLNQTHSKTFHCTYLLHYYPFDTQVFLLLCVDLLLLFFGNTKDVCCSRVAGWTCSFTYRHGVWTIMIQVFRAVKKVSFLSFPFMLSTLSRYTICWFEDGDSVQEAADQRASDHLPPILLLISYATTFFKPFYFEAAVTVNLTLMLVTTTLFVRSV